MSHCNTVKYVTLIFVVENAVCTLDYIASDGRMTGK